MIQKALTYGTVHRLSQCFFYQSTLLFNINVIFDWYLPRIMVFVVRERVAEKTEKKKRMNKRKTLKRKNEEKEKRRILGKSNNKNKHLCF